MLYYNDDLDLISDEDILDIISTFPQQRREKALAFKFALGRKECALAYLLLCRGLMEEYGIEEMPVFEYGEHGKPIIVGYPEIHFNLSHCKKAVMCYVSDRPVGIDCEVIGRGNESLVDYTMNRDEVRSIREAEDPKVEFIRLWTQKEAVLKLTGRGIDDDMKSVLVNLEGKNIKVQTFVKESKGYVWSIAQFM